MVDIYEQNPLQRLYAAGQSVWYDNIRRGVVLYGELEAMVAGDAVTGITSYSYTPDTYIADGEVSGNFGP